MSGDKYNLQYYLSDNINNSMDITPIIIQKPVKGFTGRNHSDESRKKISDSKKGVPNLKKRKGNREQAIKDRNSGMSVTDIAAKHGVSRKTIYAWFKDGSLM